MFEGINGWMVASFLLAVMLAFTFEGWRMTQQEKRACQRRLNEWLFSSLATDTFEGYSAQAMRTAMPHGSLDEALDHALLGAGSEVGELMTHFKAYKYYGKAFDREYMKKELGDVLWFLNRATLATGFTLEEVAAANIAKLKKRYPNAYSAEAAIRRADEDKEAA